MLSAVKTEFGKFGEVLGKVKKQLDTASRSIDQTGARSRAIERKLRSVEELPAEDDSAAVLGLPAVAGEVDDGEEAPGTGLMASGGRPPAKANARRVVGEARKAPEQVCAIVEDSEAMAPSPPSQGQAFTGRAFAGAGPGIGAGARAPPAGAVEPLGVRRKLPFRVARPGVPRPRCPRTGKDPGSRRPSPAVEEYSPARLGDWVKR